MVTNSGVLLTGDEALVRKLNRVRETFSTELMAEIGTLLELNIKTRTAQGIDAEGNAFDPYTTEYAFFRAKKGLPTEHVDLFFTGSMMSSMTYEASRREVRLFFMPTEDKHGMSNPAKAYYLNEKRKFFSISEDDVREIEALVKDAFSEVLRS